MPLHDKATHKPKGAKAGIPIAVVIAGSEGVDNTVRYLALSAYNLGFRTVVVDPKDLFDKEKICLLVSAFKARYPNEKVFGLGVEYGANLLLNTAA